MKNNHANPQSISPPRVTRGSSSPSDHLKDKRFADIRLKNGLKQYTYNKEQVPNPRGDLTLEKTMGLGNDGSANQKSPLRDFYIPPDISENHWGEINKFVYQELQDDLNKNREKKLQQRIDLK